MPLCVPGPSQLDADSANWPDLLRLNIWLRGNFACLIMLAAAIHCWAVASAAKPGMQRLLACLPVIAALHAVPLLFHHKLEPFATISSTFLAVRLTSGKVIAFILGRGVLVLPLSLLQFMAVMLAPFMPAQLVATRLQLQQQQPGGHMCTAAPAGTAAQTAKQLFPFPKRQGLYTLWQQVTPKQRYSLDSSNSNSSKKAATPNGPSPMQAGSSTADGPAGSSNSLTQDEVLQSKFARNSAMRAASSTSGRSIANLLLNALVVAAFAAYSCSSTQRIVAVATHLSGMWVMWKGMETLMHAASAPARDWLGMTLAPHFINPFRSSSLTDFWARRWNITQGLVLRFFVYEPIIQGRLVAATTGATALLVAPAPAAPAPAAAAAAGEDCHCQAGCKQHHQQLKHMLHGSTISDNPAAAAQLHGAAASSLGTESDGKPATNARGSGLRCKAHSSPCHSITATAGTHAQHNCLNAAKRQPTVPTSSAQVAHAAGTSEALSLSEVYVVDECNGCDGRGDACSCAAAAPADAAVHGSNSTSTISTGANAATGASLPAAQQLAEPSLSPLVRCGSDLTLLTAAAAAAAAGATGAAAFSNNSSSSSLKVPVLAAPSAPRAPCWRRQLAAAATFVVSGFEHELFLFYVTRTIGWRWFVFFSMQGVLLAAESVLKRRCSAAGLQLHPVVASLAVLLVLGLTADFFFWPPLLQRELVEPLVAAMPQQLLQLLGVEECPAS